MRKKREKERRRHTKRKKERGSAFFWVLFGVAGFGASCRGGSDFGWIFFFVFVNFFICWKRIIILLIQFII